MSDIARVRQEVDHFAAALPGWTDTIERAMRRRDVDELRDMLEQLGQSALEAKLGAIEQLARELDARLLSSIDFDDVNAAVEELLAISWRAVGSR